MASGRPTDFNWSQWWEAWAKALMPQPGESVLRPLGRWVALALALLVIVACIVGICWLAARPV